MYRILSILLVICTIDVAIAQNDTDKVMYDVEVNPTWKGCNEKSDSLRIICFEQRLAGFFDDFILYPDKAKQKGIEGVVVVQFIIEKDGSISNIRILHDIGEGCGDEVIRALQHLPKLIPGEDHGQTVRVIYKASFKFKLK